MRLDGSELPEWFEPDDDQIALFVTPPLAFDLAAQLERTLLGCPSDWTIRLPARFLVRSLQQMSLQEALHLDGASFIKHSISKAFPAGIYRSAELAEVTVRIPRAALVHVGEPVHWLAEYRCFVRAGSVATISPYQRHGEVIGDDQSLFAPPEELEQARQFAQAVLYSPDVAFPPAFVLDVGLIEGRGWAVVEFNECWAAGIYACKPVHVLATLIAACVPTSAMSPTNWDWDFRQHYLFACATEPE
ncbi:ATP-grasp domain-containing protein [Anatilimnocola sp. NA78]|uniref:ATP-grasp domain-containing protein n=1 Tax=Anatilimnocola sp. NA78 TaxID=3415683 RepID=UPI003CE5B483